MSEMKPNWKLGRKVLAKIIGDMDHSYEATELTVRQPLFSFCTIHAAWNVEVGSLGKELIGTGSNHGCRVKESSATTKR